MVVMLFYGWSFGHLTRKALRCSINNSLGVLSTTSPGWADDLEFSHNFTVGWSHPWLRS